MLLENVKTDLHAHGWCGQEEGLGQIIMKILGETGERNLQTIAEKGFSQGQNTLIGLINFDDTRYQKIINTREKLGKDFDIYDDNKERFMGVYNKAKDLWCHILRGQEIPTNEGHLFILGNNRDIQRRNIEDVFKEAKDMSAINIGDHILFELGLLSKIFGKLMSNGVKKYSLGKEGVKKHKEQLDLLEYCNSNFPDLTTETESLGKEVGLKGIYCSDSHILNQIFSSYTIFSELDFTNWYSLRESLMKGINNGTAENYRGANRKLEGLYHGLAVCYNIARQKIGIVKNPVIEIN